MGTSVAFCEGELVGRTEGLVLGFLVGAMGFKDGDTVGLVLGV